MKSRGLTDGDGIGSSLRCYYPLKTRIIWNMHHAYTDEIVALHDATVHQLTPDTSIFVIKFKTARIPRAVKAKSHLKLNHVMKTGKGS
jgi:hypothetical protein